MGLTAAAGHAAAQVTYDFQGGLYNTVTNGSTCTVGDCATYANTHRGTASITFAGPLAPNLPSVDVSGQVTSFSFSDGVSPTTTGPGPNGSISSLSVVTDSAGALVGYVIILQRTPGPPYLASTPADANSRFDYVLISPGASSVVKNAICTGRGLTVPGSSAGNCSGVAQDTNTSMASSSTATTFTVSSVATVPTLSEWAMIGLALALAGAAVAVIQRRRVAA